MARNLSCLPPRPRQVPAALADADGAEMHLEVTVVAAGKRSSFAALEGPGTSGASTKAPSISVAFKHSYTFQEFL